MIKPLRQLLSDYKSAQKAIPAFNIDSFEIYQAVEAAVAETGAPCIVQLSDGEDQFIKGERLLILVKKARIDGLPIYTNMDHGRDPRRLEHLIRLGFDMVHLDGSTLEYSANLALSKDFVTKVKTLSPEALVEVEFNHINLVGVVGSTVSSDSFTLPSQAKEFMDTTRADLLAVSIGNLHGVSRELPEKLDLELFQKITDKLPPETFCTLHGGSGISVDQITAAIKLGIVKININTDFRLQIRQSLQKHLAEISSIKAYDYLSPVVTDLKEIAVAKLVQFSSHV